MSDLRYIAVAIVILVFMLVTVGHVANYAGSFETGAWQILGWPYAIAVDAAIIICAWLTRWKTTRRWAVAGYIGFVIASGMMNAAAVKPWLQPWPEWLFAWIYALFPTAAIGLLGFLARQAEAVSEISKPRGILARMTAALDARKDERAEPATVPDVDRPAPAMAQPAATLDDLDRAILRTLTDQPDLSSRALARTVEGARSTVAGRVQAKLEPAGLLVRSGDEWTVHWSDNGAETK